MGERSVRALSLLRERFEEEEGEGGTCSEFDDMLVPDLRLAISLALRLRARSLCSLNGFGAAPGEAAGSGNQDATDLEDGYGGGIWRAAVRARRARLGIW